jgi:hypothetical protein
MNRRTILLVVLVVVALGALLFVFTSRGTTSGSPPPHATSQAVAARGTVTPGTPGKPVATAIPANVLTTRRYAAKLLPVVNRALPIFDSSVGAAASASTLPNLAASCASNIQRIGIQTDYVDGLPHPYAWYSQPGHLHHRVLGIYHTMLEATVNCQTTASNGQRSASNAAVSDMAKAARKLHHMSGQLQSLARRAH